MTDLNLTVKLDKVLFYDLIEKIKPEIEKEINKQIRNKLQTIFTQYYKDNDLQKLTKKIMEELD